MTNLLLLAPPCSLCLEDVRMVLLGQVTTDFGGHVTGWVCQRCGVAAILTSGERPGGGNGNVSIVVKPRSDQ